LGSPSTIQITLIIIGNSVRTTDWSLESFTMRTVSRFGVRTVTGFPQFLSFAFHNTTVLESFPSSGTDWFVDIGTVARVQTSPFMVHILETTFDGTLIFVGAAVHSADWVELIPTRAVEVGRLFPVGVVARALVAHGDIGAFHSAS
jgi:hypothetical protein